MSAGRYAGRRYEIHRLLIDRYRPSRNARNAKIPSDFCSIYEMSSAWDCRSASSISCEPILVLRASHSLPVAINSNACAGGEFQASLVKTANGAPGDCLMTVAISNATLISDNASMEGRLNLS